MSGEAEYLSKNELLQGIFAELERACVEVAVNANPTSDEIRAAAMAEIRAIRSVQGKLRAMLATNPVPGPVV
jgi:hypothetical protein